jgi:hypothetical protein
VDTRNWTACSEAIDELKTATDEAQEQVSLADGAREEYQQCREGGGTCSAERAEYETARTDATRLLNAMRTRFRATAQTCGVTP